MVLIENAEAPFGYKWAKEYYQNFAGGSEPSSISEFDRCRWINIAN